jgi:hypothetical protein
MSTMEARTGSGLFTGDSWAWWQSRRLRYNLCLAAAGWAAYGLNAALFYGFGHPIWQNWRGAFSMTLFMGIVFLVVMGVANVCYLLGPAIEATVKPPEIASFRRTAFAMGLWGSVALPFVFPLISLAMLIGAPR